MTSAAQDRYCEPGGPCEVECAAPEEIDLETLPDPDGSTFWHPDYFEPFAVPGDPFDADA